MEQCSRNQAEELNSHILNLKYKDSPVCKISPQTWLANRWSCWWRFGRSALAENGLQTDLTDGVKACVSSLAWTRTPPLCYGVTSKERLLSVCLLNRLAPPALHSKWASGVLELNVRSVSRGTNHVHVLGTRLMTDRSCANVSVMVR